MEDILVSVRDYLSTVATEDADHHAEASARQRDRVLQRLAAMPSLKLAQNDALVKLTRSIAWHGADDKPILDMINAKMGGRRSQQNWETCLNFFTQRVWADCLKDPMLAIDYLCRFVAEMGLILPTEPTSRIIAAMALLCNGTGMLVTATDIEVQLAYNTVKAKLKSLYKREPLQFIERLPPSPAELLGRFPQLARRLYTAENLPVTCPLSKAAITEMCDRIECRTHSKKKQLTCMVPYGANRTGTADIFQAAFYRMMETGMMPRQNVITMCEPGSSSANGGSASPGMRMLGMQGGFANVSPPNQGNGAPNFQLSPASSPARTDFSQSPSGSPAASPPFGSPAASPRALLTSEEFGGLGDGLHGTQGAATDGPKAPPQAGTADGARTQADGIQDAQKESETVDDAEHPTTEAGNALGRIMAGVTAMIGARKSDAEIKAAAAAAKRKAAADKKKAAAVKPKAMKKTAKQVLRAATVMKKPAAWVKKKPQGCSKCRWSPGCTPSCWAGRGGIP